jgi:exopolyphosphatase/guanosine-5'-triphosphate,3'-diphosphate pyrophosphatase
MAQRLAVIDIGSNTLHLLVADVTRGGVRAVHDRKVRSALGVAVTKGGVVGAERMRAIAAVVRRFANEARHLEAEDTLLIGTHAVRATGDRAAVIAALETAARTSLRLLTPEEEAALCLAGAGLEPLPPPPFLLVDIGGGSSDLAVVGQGGIVDARSLSIGSGVLAARFLMGDPPWLQQVEAADAMVRGVLWDLMCLEGESFPEMVVTGGAGRRLRRQFGVPPHAGHASPTSRLLPLIERLLQQTCAEWPHPLKDPERGEIIRAGAVILRAMLLRWDVPSWRVSSYGLREGALSLRAQGRWHEILPPHRDWSLSRHG